MTKFVIQLLALIAICALSTSHWKVTDASPAVANDVQRRDPKSFQILFSEENDVPTTVDDGEKPGENVPTTESSTSDGSTDSSTENDGSSEQPPTSTPNPNGAQSQWLSLCIASLALVALILNTIN